MDTTWLKLFLSLILGYCSETSAGTDSTESPVLFDRDRDWDGIEAIKEVAAGSAKLKCPYQESNSETLHFLCKGRTPHTCQMVINTTQDQTTKSRITVRVNKRLKQFTVTIMALRGNDSGTYWCFSDRGRPAANYTKLHLTVKGKLGATSPRPPSTPTVHPLSTQNGSPLSAVVSGTLSLLLLGGLFLSFLMYRHRRRGAQAGTRHAMPSSESRKMVRPLAADIGDEAAVYSTLTLPTLETDSVHYASVRHPVSSPSAPRPPSASCVYSAVNVIGSDGSRAT